MSDFTNSSDATQYRSDRDIVNTDRANVPPQCIQALPKSQPSRKPLSGEEAKAAVTELYNNGYTKLEFPRNMKSRVDPTIFRQNYGLVSFVPSVNAIPDKEGCFGVMKFRGAFQSEEEAEDYARHLITDVDSYSEISVCRIGYEFPVMVDDTIYTAATREIDIRQKMDETYKANFKKKREEEKKQMKEIQERREMLMDPTHQKAKDKAVDDIDLYIELRVKKANAMMAQDECKKTMDSAVEIARKTDVLLEKLEKEHPDFRDEYLERYKRALTATGSSITQNPLINYMVRSDEQAAQQASAVLIAETSADTEEEKKEEQQ